jgi:hypothetical protein
MGFILGAVAIIVGGLLVLAIAGLVFLRILGAVLGIKPATDDDG